MKRLFTLLVPVFFNVIVFGQSPQKMSYQAVIRNNSNVLVTSSPVGMRISILQGSSTGTEVYKEVYNPNPQTNASGLVAIEIGGGIALTGTFAAVDWSAGTYFIKTETDPTGGTNYTITGTSQLLSVPYALYAKTASAHYVGESYGGGIVFYVYDNGQHGLIAATADQSTGIRWYAGTYTYTMAKADGVGAGKANTALIIANQGNGDGATYAARICNEYAVTVGDVTYSDWYLPSDFELNLLFLQKSVIGGFAVSAYWCSDENFDLEVWVRNFDTGLKYVNQKGFTGSVRAIRSF